MSLRVNRRRFLTRSAAGTAAGAVAAGLGAVHTEAAPKDEPLQLGLIGCGGIMRHHVRGLAERRSGVSLAWFCDVDPRQLDTITQLAQPLQKSAAKRTACYEDVLADSNVQAVIVATPHHWHVPITLRAIQAGKDVYCEKPLSHVLREGRLVVDAAARYGCIVQHGSQMRSSPVTARAGQLLEQGILGEVKVAKAWNVQSRGMRQAVPDSDPPAGVDYDRWLGPAPVRPFNVNRFHKNWRVYRDYGNGDIGDDGVHDIDMARWGLGVETHPIRVTAHGSTIHLKGGDREYPDNMLVTYQYADDKVLIYEDRLFTPYGMHGFDSGNAFYGTDGYMIFSRRGAFSVFLGPKGKPGPTEGQPLRGQRGSAEHMEGFLDAVRKRTPPNCGPEVAHLSCALVHLGEIAYRTCGALDFDPQGEQFIEKPAANAMLTKQYRAPFGLPTVLGPQPEHLAGH